MKSTGIACLLVVALAVGVQGPVQARPASHSGTPSSMRSGFSSQKQHPAPSAPQSNSRSNSAANRDMARNAAQANALKTYDARRSTAVTTPSAPMPVYNQPAYPQQIPQPVIVQPQGNALMHGVIGFMLGRAMSPHTQMSYPPEGPAPAPAATVDGAAAPVAAAAMTPAPTPAPSFLASAVRVFFWLLLMSGLVWLVVYLVWKARRLRAAHAARYAFERN